MTAHPYTTLHSRDWRFGGQQRAGKPSRPGNDNDLESPGGRVHVYECTVQLKPPFAALGYNDPSAQMWWVP